MWSEEQGDDGWKREISDEAMWAPDAPWAGTLGGDGTTATSAAPFDHYAE